MASLRICLGEVTEDLEMARTYKSTFEAPLLRPAKPGIDRSWAFLILPKSVSETLPRRGRTSVEGVINGCPFQATLDPDGQLSHWLKVSDELREAAGARIGELVTVDLSPATIEPEPQLPDDLKEALTASLAAWAAWDDTTTVARVDWIHWLDSAKQARTRRSRVVTACDMLSSGKKRICCFDQSGFYSRSFGAPLAAM